MIRIVDILKKVGMEEKKETTLPADKQLPIAGKPVPVETPAVKKEPIIAPFDFDELLIPLSNLLASKSNEAKDGEEAKLIWTALNRLISQQFEGQQDLVKQLAAHSSGRNAFAPVLKVVLTAIKLGKDSGYNQQQLGELAMAAIIQVLEASSFAGALNLPLFKTNMRVYGDFNLPGYAQTVNLAQIYELNA